MSKERLGNIVLANSEVAGGDPLSKGGTRTRISATGLPLRREEANLGTYSLDLMPEIPAVDLVQSQSARSHVLRNLPPIKITVSSVSRTGGGTKGGRRYLADGLMSDMGME